VTEPAPPLAGKIALVTGASRGLGRAVALSLAGVGAKIVATARTQGALEELDDAVRAAGGESVTLVPMDLAKPDGVDQLGLALFERHHRLDILVHAAGMLGGLRPLAHVPPVLWERLVATNLTATYRLIRSLDPLLRASDAGRAVFITCDQARTPGPFWGAYAATKAGMEAMVRSWADEVDSSPARALLVDPGPMRTALRHQAFPGEDKAALTDPAEPAAWISALVGATADPGAPAQVLTYRRASGRSAAINQPLTHGQV
jgi:NAD(P)-dependent dehydrogenase (short-subunit alcohol dehydrogenase family)